MGDEPVLVRIAGLPGRRVTEWTFADTRACAQRYEQAQAELDLERSSLEEELHDRVPLAADVLTRRALIGLRRAVHNDRVALPGVVHLASEALPAAVRRQILTWQSLLERRDRAADDGERADRQDWARLAVRLSGTFAEPRVRRGIVTSQRQLYRDLERGLGADGAASGPGQDGHRQLKTLHAYLWRMATKSSPLSTLTVVAVGRPAEADEFTVGDVTDTVATSVLAPAAVGAVARSVDQAAAAAGRRRLCLAEPVTQTADEISFLVPAEPGTSEFVRSVPSSALLQVVLTALRAAGGAVEQSALVAELASGVDLPPSVVQGVVAQLVELRLLRPTLSFCSAEPNALAQVGTAARAADQPELAGRIQAITSDIGRLGGLCDSSYASALDDIEAGLETIVAGSTYRPDSHRLFERHLVRHPVAVPGTTLASIRRDLRGLMGMLQLTSVEVGVPEFVQVALNDAFARDTDALTAFCTVRTAVAAVCGNPLAPLGQAAAQTAMSSRLAAARCELAHELLAMSRPGTPVDLGDTWVSRWAVRAAELVGHQVPASAGFLGQLAELPAGGVVFVLNRSTPGHGTLAAGWTGQTVAGSESLTEDLRRRVTRLAPDSEVVELRAGLGFGGQVQPRLTRRCLEYPAVREGGGSGPVVPWTDVVVRRDPALGRWVLWDARRQRRLLPLHLGSISPLYFPPFYEFLASFGPAPVSDLAFVDRIDAADEGREDRGGTHVHPRIRYRDVVLSRATWCVPRQQLPINPGNHLSFSGFLRLRRWARDAGLPDRVFVSTANAHEVLRERQTPRSTRSDRRPLSHKPVFVDFDDAGSCQLLHRYAGSRGDVLRVTEAVPDPTSLTPRTAAAGRVTELLLEIDQPS